MGPTSGSRLAKAFFTNLDTRSVFAVQYNPSALRLDEAVRWRAPDTAEPVPPSVTFQGHDASWLVMELVFDTTDRDDDVLDAWVRPLRRFVEAAPQGPGRPPFCTFTWGNLQFEGVVESIDTEFLMFRRDGAPLRARCTVTLRRARPPIPQGAPVRVARQHRVGPGDTLATLSVAYQVPASAIALANGLDDPLALPTGEILAIPHDPADAQALATARRRRAPARWSEPRR